VQKFTEAQRLTATQWLYRLLLKSTVPSSYGAIVLQTPKTEAVAIWLPKG
jgi:hypothetical protein